MLRYAPRLRFPSDCWPVLEVERSCNDVYLERAEMAHGGLGADVPLWFRNQYKVKKLSGNAFAAWVKLACWCVANKSDGVLPGDIAEVEPDISRDGLNELHKDGFITPRSGGGFLLADYDRTQSSASEIEQRLEARRESDRKRQQRHREKQREDGGLGGSGSLSRDSHVTDNVTDNVTVSVSPSGDTSSRDSHVMPVRERCRERVATQGAFENSFSLSDSGVSYEGSFENLPVECGEAGCSENAFGRTGFCYEHLDMRRAG